MQSPWSQKSGSTEGHSSEDTLCKICIMKLSTYCHFIFREGPMGPLGGPLRGPWALSLLITVSHKSVWRKVVRTFHFQSWGQAEIDSQFFFVFTSKWNCFVRINFLFFMRNWFANTIWNWFASKVVKVTYSILQGQFGPQIVLINY